MKKYILVLFLVVFIIPSVVFASWWNPFSWFSKNIKQPTAVQQVGIVPIQNNQSQNNPALKIASCEVTKKLKFKKYENSINQQFNQGIQKLSQTISQEKEDKMSEIFSDELNTITRTQSENQNLSIENQQTANARSLEVMNGAVGDLANYWKDYYQNKYNTEYTNLKRKYQQQIDNYLQSLNLEYLQCLNQ